MGSFKVQKTYQQINDKIRSGDVVVVTAEEMIDIVNDNGPEEAARQVDVVTTGTFAPMCSSGAFINFGHSAPGTKAAKVWINNVAGVRWYCSGGLLYRGHRTVRRRPAEQGVSRRIPLRWRSRYPGSGGRQEGAFQGHRLWDGLLSQP
jgi:uncharacterized protein (DUF39 family)